MRPRLSLALSILLIATACGGSEDAASLTLSLSSDAPATFEKVPVTIVAVEAQFMGSSVQNQAAYQQAAMVGDPVELPAQNQVATQSAEGEGEWVRLMERTQQQDLLQLKDGNQLQLAKGEVPSGFYKRLRLRLQKAEVVDGGESHELAVPQEGVELQFQFQLKKKSEHELVVEFDAGQSVQANNEGGFDLAPFAYVKRFRYLKGEVAGTPPEEVGR